MLCSIASEIWSARSAPVQYATISADAEDPEIADYVAECARIHALRTQHLWAWLTKTGHRLCPARRGILPLPQL